MSGCILKQSVSIKNCQEKKNSKTYTIKPNYLYHIKKKEVLLWRQIIRLTQIPNGRRQMKGNTAQVKKPGSGFVGRPWRSVTYWTVWPWCLTPIILPDYQCVKWMWSVVFYIPWSLAVRIKWERNQKVLFNFLNYKILEWRLFHIRLCLKISKWNEVKIQCVKITLKKFLSP